MSIFTWIRSRFTSIGDWFSRVWKRVAPTVVADIEAAIAAAEPIAISAVTSLITSQLPGGQKLDVATKQVIDQMKEQGYTLGVTLAKKIVQDVVLGLLVEQGQPLVAMPGADDATIAQVEKATLAPVDPATV